jgi:hypothetical protein
LERILDGQDNYRGDQELVDERWIDATGADVKLGAIFLPIEDSPFRIGLSIATPTWYDVKSENATTLYNDTDPNYFNYGADKWNSSEVYEFKYYTPWKFGLSVGHTIDQYIALGASYEYSSMGSASTRVYNGHLNYYDEEDTDPDRVMNNHTDRSLKGVSLLKAGVERPAGVNFSGENLNDQLATLKAWYNENLVTTYKLGDARDSQHNPLYINFRPKYYLLGLSSGAQSHNKKLPQTIGWQDYNNGGANGTFDPLAE